MNPFRKIYCRTFQIVFRIALPVLPYRNPALLDSIAQIPALLKQKGLSRPLVVTDAALAALPPFSVLTDGFKENGIAYAVYDGTKPNPTTDMAEKALAIYRENQCDCLVALGGGSPMDCAKAVGARVARPKKSLEKMAGILRVRKKIPLLIAIPTTAGTGSETTLAAVIVDAATRHKYVINDFPLIPSYAVLDPATVKTLPFSVAATTGMDALTHAVEAYIGRSTSKYTRSLSLEAVQLIFANVEKAARHESVEAEKAMLKAAHLAGLAFTRSYVGYIHAVSHSLSGKYNLPHGLTNAVILPIDLEMYGKAAEKKLARLAEAAGVGSASQTDGERARAFIDAVYALNKRLDIPDRISGIKEEDIDELAAYADKEANPLYPVPVLWNKEELKAVYRKVSA